MDLSRLRRLPVRHAGRHRARARPGLRATGLAPSAAALGVDGEARFRDRLAGARRPVLEHRLRPPQCARPARVTAFVAAGFRAAHGGAGLDYAPLFALSLGSFAASRYACGFQVPHLASYVRLFLSNNARFSSLGICPKLADRWWCTKTSSAQAMRYPACSTRR